MRRGTYTSHGDMMRQSTSTRSPSKLTRIFRSPIRVWPRSTHRLVSTTRPFLRLKGRSPCLGEASSFLMTLATSTRAGKRDDARKVLEDLDRLANDEYVPSYGRAVICAALGNKENAMNWLEKAYKERNFLVY